MRQNFHHNDQRTIGPCSATFVKSARGKRLNAFEENRTIDAARVKSDLRRDGGSGPANIRNNLLTSQMI